MNVKIYKYNRQGKTYELVFPLTDFSDEAHFVPIREMKSVQFWASPYTATGCSGFNITNLKTQNARRVSVGSQNHVGLAIEIAKTNPEAIVLLK